MQFETHADIGRALRDARLTKRLDIRQMARASHIRACYLEALEEGTLEALPGPVYVRGYLRHYARLLTLPDDAIVDAYERIGAVQPRRFFYLPEIIRKEERPGHILLGVTLGLAIVLTVWLHDFFSPRREVSARVPEFQQALPAEAARERIRASACLEPSPSAWPPCYYNALPAFSPFLTGMPLHVAP